MATRYVPGAGSIEIPLRDTDEVSLMLHMMTVREPDAYTKFYTCS